MIILIVKNLKKKSIILALFFALWLGMFLLSNLIVNNMSISRITIDDVFSFSYPPILIIGKIYINEQSTGIISVSSNIAKPDSQKFSTYISLKGKFAFDYPSIFTLIEKEFPDSDILYHIDFKDTQGIIHGFVQVWNLPYSLKEFLDNSKANSTLSYKNFKSQELDIDEKKGYLWDYTVFSDNEKIYYKGMEFFFKKKDSMYRISYFVPEKEWDKTKENIFWSIVKSFKVY
ncbi:MAG: hypothetical protein HPY74_09980 [Firmicutes bacterium]|nr:hypothetical protein [Bacillota bacterium]